MHLSVVPLIRRGFARTILAALGVTLAGAHAQPDLRSAAEKSDYRATALHADVVALLDALAATYPNARRVSLGTSHEGRDLPMLIVSDEPVGSAADARRQVEERGKVLVFAIGNIHAGEPDGKEALPMLARELLAANDPLLKHVILAIAPIYNADGNERVSPDNRPGQNGPVLGMGVRENAQGLDLNRDFIKLKAPETRGLVRFLTEWDPHLFIDCHVTNGSLHRYVITTAGPKNLAGDAGVRIFARDVMIPGVGERYTALSGEPTFWYGSFGADVFSGEDTVVPTRWGTFPPEARFGTTYVGLRGRLSLLVEAYSYTPFRERVLRTRDYVRAAMEWCAENAAEVHRVTREADARARTGQPPKIVIRSRTVACPGEVTILGYDKTSPADRENPGAPREYRVSLMDCFEPETVVTRPAAYVIARDERLAPAIETLRLHGVRIDEAADPFEADGETYILTRATPASRPFQGHVLVRAEVEARDWRVGVHAGDWVVPMDQPLANLAAYMLEPHSEDGLLTWNFFDAFLDAGTELPVRRITAMPTAPAPGAR